MIASLFFITGSMNVNEVKWRVWAESAQTQSFRAITPRRLRLRQSAYCKLFMWRLLTDHFYTLLVDIIRRKSTSGQFINQNIYLALRDFVIRTHMGADCSDI